jgi:hypothetical protein
MSKELTHEYNVSLNGALAGAATHEGTQFAMRPSHSVWREFGAVFLSDVASAANGAKLQASVDGVAWRDVKYATLSANVAAELVCPVIAPFMRAVLVNAAGAASAAFVSAFRRA